MSAALSLRTEIDHRDVVDRNEDHDVRPVVQDLLDHRLLLVDIVGLARNEVRDARPGRARNLVGGDAERLVGRIGRVLGEHRDVHILAPPRGAYLPQFHISPIGVEVQHGPKLPPVQRPR